MQIKMKKIIFINFIVLSLTACGLEDILFFESPTGFRYVEEGSGESGYVEFTGFNQEQEDTGRYCFIGYDIYYYFDSESTKAKAQLYLPNPYLSEDDWIDLSDITVNRLNQELLPWSYFYEGREDFYGKITEKYQKELYRYVTLPVTLQMIKDVLYDGNSSNVRAYFGDIYSKKEEFSNPDPELQQSEYISFFNLFPNIEHYPDDFNYEEYEKNGKEFKGFRDERFYKKMKVNPVSGTTNRYKCYFYAVAKGFDSTTKTSFTVCSESSKSSTISIEFEVAPETME
jgi:hypothetical protein